MLDEIDNSLFKQKDKLTEISEVNKTESNRELSSTKVSSTRAITNMCQQQMDSIVLS